MQIFDNLFSAEYQNNILNILFHNNFPWFYYKSTGASNYEDINVQKNLLNTENTLETSQFVHVFYLNEKAN